MSGELSSSCAWLVVPPYRAKYQASVWYRTRVFSIHIIVFELRATIARADSSCYFLGGRGRDATFLEGWCLFHILPHWLRRVTHRRDPGAFGRAPNPVRERRKFCSRKNCGTLYHEQDIFTVNVKPSLVPYTTCRRAYKHLGVWRRRRRQKRFAAAAGGMSKRKWKRREW